MLRKKSYDFFPMGAFFDITMMRGGRMNKLHWFFSTIFRLVIVGFVIFMHIQSYFNYEQNYLIMYAVLGLYVLVFSLLKSNKWAAYLESTCILVLVVVYPFGLFSFLFIMPFSAIVSSKASKFDLFLFSLVIASYVYYISEGDWLLTGISYLGLITVLLLFQVKFDYIAYLEKDVYRAKDDVLHYKKNLNNMGEELSIVTDMFIKMRELNEVVSEEELVDQMIRSARDFFDAHYACLYLKTNDYFVVKYEVGDNEMFTVPDVLSVNDIYNHPLTTERLNVVIEEEMLEENGNQKAESELPWGVLRVYGKQSSVVSGGRKVFSPYTDMDYEILVTYVQQAFKRLCHIRLSESNRYLSNYCGLTKIPNRRYFEQQVHQYIERAKRGETFSFLIIDIDHFKGFNDTYGHMAGDEVLKKVAETISNSVRKPGKVDIVARLGGEEFCVLLYKPKDPLVAAERVRRNIQQLQTPYGTVTVSIGMAHFDEDGSTWESLYSQADKALYEAKENGRNQVIEYKP